MSGCGKASLVAGSPRQRTEGEERGSAPPRLSPRADLRTIDLFHPKCRHRSCGGTGYAGHRRRRRGGTGTPGWGQQRGVGLGRACWLRSRRQQERRCSAIHLLAGALPPAVPLSSSSACFNFPLLRAAPARPAAASGPGKVENWQKKGQIVPARITSLPVSAPPQEHGQDLVANNVLLQLRAHRAVGRGQEKCSRFLIRNLDWVRTGVVGDGREGQCLRSSPTPTSRL